MHKFLLALTLLLAANAAAVNETATSIATPAIDHSKYNSNLVTAHRGSSSSAPENTLSSIRRAIEDGAGYAELDVQETSDGIPILMHDISAKRTTGIDKPVWQISYNELQQASAGAWFHQQFENERVPTLEQVIETASDRIKLNIELKNNGHQQRLAEATVELLEKHHFEKNCTVTSFDKALLRKVKQQNPNIKTGLIADKKPSSAASLEEFMSSPDYDVISAAYPMVDQQFVSSASAHHKQVYVWTVNDPKLMETMRDLNVDSIITNQPEQLIQLLSQKPKQSL
ncbi:glycerophosphodiester phosphodiesterase [Paenibacillus rigui]|uniref:Glycerophosphodiester phosphodiesterase n=1 Tax=Paenibacillus rigui TaxID=554312 RepID=A0A229UQB1_9BACL|nr:glycerophosphodiester phosphodiesterase family protein [Paenibacillus rigui]OXM85553.1 glycerophosphodiester phosphodiesterase [Paenibacillus rigui]